MYCSAYTAGSAIEDFMYSDNVILTFTDTPTDWQTFEVDMEDVGHIFEIYLWNQSVDGWLFSEVYKYAHTLTYIYIPFIIMEIPQLPTPPNTDPSRISVYIRVINKCYIHTHNVNYSIQ